MLYIPKARYIIFYVSTILLFLLIDLGQFFLIGTPIISLLLSFYCIRIINDPAYTIVAFISFLLGLEYFCFYNSFLLAYIVFIPISAFGIFFRKNLYSSYSHSIILAMIATLIQIYAIEGYFLGILPSSYYTIMRIGGTLLLGICFSLTINIWGVRDNRT